MRGNALNERNKSMGTSKNLLRGHLLHLRASLCTSKAACLGAISAPLATVFRSPPISVAKNAHMQQSWFRENEIETALPLSAYIDTDSACSPYVERT